MTKITLPQFYGGVTAEETRRLVHALELRFQQLEAPTDTSTDGLTQAEADALYATLVHTHVEADITDLSVPDTLSDLSDVSTSAPSTNDLLAWNGSSWVPTAPSSSSSALNDLTDVDTSGVSNGEVLTYNSSSMEWEPATASSGSLAGLSDTNVSPAAGDLLFYEGSNWEETGGNLRWVDGSNRFDLTGALRIINGSDYVEHSHDGTDFYSTSTNTTNYIYDGSADNYAFGYDLAATCTVRIGDAAVGGEKRFRLLNTQHTSGVDFVLSGTGDQWGFFIRGGNARWILQFDESDETAQTSEDWDFIGTTRVRTGNVLSVWDATNANSMSFQHDASQGEIICDDQISLQADGVEEFATQDSSAAGNTSGAVVMDDQQNSRPVGFNDKRVITITGDITLDDSHAGARLRKTAATTNIDIILPSATTEFGSDSSTDFWNLGNSTVNIDATTNSVTLNWADGSTVQTGDRTIAYGGVCTIERVSATVYDIAGQGIS